MSFFRPLFASVLFAIGSFAPLTRADSPSPPTFTSQPAATSLATAVGASLHIDGATVTSSTPLDYQWMLNGAPIPGATSTTYSKAVVSLSDAGRYTLVVTNAAGSASSSAVHVVVTPRPGSIASGQTSIGRPKFTNGTVHALLALPEGGALIGGAFGISPANNLPQAHLVRVRYDGSIDPTFSISLNNPVQALLAQPDGKILVAGDFTSLGGATQRHLFRLNSDLSPDAAFNSAVATALNTPGSMPRPLALDSSGRIYIGINATPGSIRRFSTAGSLDAGYSVSTSPFSFSFGSSGVSALAVQADDKLVVSGDFSRITGSDQIPVSKSHLARVNPDSSVDTDFASSPISTAYNLVVTPTGRLFSAGTTLIEHSPSNGSTLTSSTSGGLINRMIFGPDGRLTIARNASGGLNAITRVDIPVGAIPTNDQTFQVGAGPNNSISALAYAADGSLWIAGAFTTFDGFASGGVARLNAFPGNPGIVNPPVRTDVNAGGTATLFVGAVGDALTYQWFKNGVALEDDDRISGATTAVLRIADLTPEDDDSYTVEVTGGTPSATVSSAPAKLNVLGAPLILVSPSSTTPALGATVTLAADVLAATPATYVWTRGDTVIVNGGRYSGATTGTLVITDANSSDNGDYTLTVTNAFGTATTTPASMIGRNVYTARVSPTSIVNALSGIRAILHLPDGRTLLATTSASGAESSGATGQLVVVNVDQTVSPLPDIDFGDEAVADLLLQPDGKILVAGGSDFPLLVRLNADLTRDTGFAPPPPASIGRFEHLALDSLGRVYVGGDFRGYAGNASLDYLVRFDCATGALDTTFAAAERGVKYPVQALVSDASGRIIVGLGFSVYAYEYLTEPFFPLLRLTSIGEPDPSFQTEAVEQNLSLYAIECLATDASGRIYLSSRFNRSASHLVSFHRLLPDGALDDAFNPPGSFNQAPTSLLPLANGKILVGGPFTTPVANLVRLEANGAIDTDFSVDARFQDAYGVTIKVFSPDTGGRLWVGGYFDGYQDVPASNLAVLNADSPAFAIIRQPGDISRDLASSATFNVGAIGNNGLSYEWLKNGVPLADSSRISGSTTASLTISELVPSDAATYSVRVSIPGADLVSASAKLTVLAAPIITKAPTNATVLFHQTATFTGAAAGASALTYQWLFEDEPLTDGMVDGVTIAGAASPTLTITDATFAQAGAYRLLVSNSHGSATSQIGRLTVTTPAEGFISPDLLQPRLNGRVFALLCLADDSMLVAGWFTEVSVGENTFPRDGLARFLADGSLDPDFAPELDGTVYAMAQDSAGRVFIGGDFTTVSFGSTTAQRFRVARLTPALALDEAFSPSAARPANVVYALAPTNDGGTYVGGSKNVMAAPVSLARHNAFGALDASFPAPDTYSLYDSSSDNEVLALLRRPDGKLYVATRYAIRLVAADGVYDQRFAWSVHNPRTLRLHPNGTLFVGTADGEIHRLNPDTGAIIAPDLSSGHSGGVTALSLQDDGKVVSGSHGVLKRSNPATGVDDSGFLSFDDNLSALAVDRSGRIWVGGSFQQYGGFYSPHLVILVGRQESRNGLTAQTISFPAIPNRFIGATPTDNTITLTATSSAGLTPVTFSVKSSTPAGIAAILGDTLSITGTGTITVEASQSGGKAGGLIYAPAPPVSQTFQVTEGPATRANTITFIQPAAATYGDEPLNLVATASSGLPAAFELVSTAPAGIAQLSGSQLTLLV